ncbi:G2/M phase-specific E3 ubiquitin-protein ligase [Centroberyx gerrardi]
MRSDAPPPTQQVQTPRFHARRFSNWSGLRAKRRQKPSYHRDITFFKDVILLCSPRDNKIPKQQMKTKLHEKGHILSALELDKTWDHTTLLLKLREAFDGKIPLGASLEMLMPCGNKLVTPTLGKGQQLDASMVHKIFRRATLYLRPSVALQPEGSDSSTEEDEWVEEEDMFVPATAIAQASCSTQQEVQTFSSQPSTSDQTPSQWQNDYGTYINLINETSDEDNEDDLYSAIIASIEDTTRPKEHIPISQILSELSDKIDNLQVCKFNINRSAVLDGAIRGFRRLSYDPNKKMSIKFSDDRGTTEEAVDLGGPRREFLHLLMEALAESDMFEGPEGHLNLALISSAVREDRYFIAGRAVAVSLVHGGPPPCFLSRTLFACIAEGPDACRPVLEDITDMELYSKLKQVSEAKTLEELQQFTEPLTDYLANAGCLRHLTSLVDKDQLLEDVLMFQVVQRVRGPLERFSDGLKTLGVLQKIKHHPEAFRPVLCYSPGTLTAEIMDDLFDIRWSEMGSNNRANENRVVAYWRDYLQDAEEEEGPAKLGDILSFATGCHVVPPIGFSPKPSLEFQRGRYPIANTCVNCLRIPLHQSYEDFKSNMDFAIQNTQQILNILIDISW